MFECFIFWNPFKFPIESKPKLMYSFKHKLLSTQSYLERTRKTQTQPQTQEGAVGLGREEKSGPHRIEALDSRGPSNPKKSP